VSNAETRISYLFQKVIWVNRRDKKPLLHYIGRKKNEIYVIPRTQTDSFSFFYVRWDIVINYSWKEKSLYPTELFFV